MLRIEAELEFIDLTIGTGQQLHEGHGQGPQGGGGHGAAPSHVGTDHLVGAGQAQLALGLLAIGPGDQAAGGRQAAGAEDHIEIGSVVGQGRHQGAALVNAGLLQGFIEGGIG